MDGGAWWAAVHGVAKSRTPLSDFTFIFHFHALEKEMATHSSVLAWRIPGTGEPGGLPAIYGVAQSWTRLKRLSSSSSSNSSRVLLIILMVLMVDHQNVIFGNVHLFIHELLGGEILVILLRGDVYSIAFCF